MAAYAGMILSAVAAFILIRTYGETLAAPTTAAPALAVPSSTATPNVLGQLLLALAAVVVAGRLLGRLFRKLGQPPVIGEVIGGVLLGPSFLGAISPTAFEFVLAPAAMPYLGVVAQLGVVFYMFLVGLDLNPDLLRGQMHATVAISHASIVVPFVLGSALALYLYPRFSAPAVPFTSFALFLGIAMAITAFPVLARILSDLKLSKSELGVVALTCAAIDDVTAWCLLAVVVGIVQARPGGAVGAVALTIAFIAAMFLVVRPWLTRALHSSGNAEPEPRKLAIAIVGVMIAALITEAIGVHALFGAFMLGAIIPHDSRLARVLSTRLESLVSIVLLPAFFAYAGTRTEIGLLVGPYEWAACALIILVATVGKVGATLGAARITGFTWRAAAALGMLMNTRGLMQLIVLNVGLELGVITPTVFTMMVLMALATTVATTPALRRLVVVGRS